MAAKKLYLDYAGDIPNDPTVWSQLPGVGRYVLGAVLSQAFDRKLPIVEANSLRVLTRLFGYNRNPHDTSGKKWLWQAAEAILPNKRVGDFNQSLMELGALVCTSSLPQCSKCPLAKDCIAYRDGLQHSIPLRKQTQKITEVREVAIVIRHRGKLLLCLRPANADRWQNMWECPHAEVRDGESNETAALRVARELTGLKVQLVREAFFVKHGVTRFTITMACFEAVYNGGTFTSNFYTEGRWVQIDELDNYPVSSPQRKLLVKFG
jgi:A/G-specific adenine glycosylase